MHYLYTITNGKNGKVYVGQSIKPDHRWCAHKYLTKINSKKQLIHVVMAKYGIENFNFEIIACCKTQEDTDHIEISLIKQYNSLSPEGYNIKEGGSCSIMTEESKKKISLSMMGNTRMLGNKLSKETKLLMSEMGKKNINGIKALNDNRWYGGSKGYHHTEENKKKMSISHSGEKCYNAKLTWEIVSRIRQEYIPGVFGYCKLAKKYSIDMKQIQRIIKNKCWVIKDASN